MNFASLPFPSNVIVFVDGRSPQSRGALDILHACFAALAHHVILAPIKKHIYASNAVFYTPYVIFDFRDFQKCLPEKPSTIT